MSNHNTDKSKKTILMVAAARTGSTRLSALMSQHQFVCGLGELFNPQSRKQEPASSTCSLYEAGFIPSPDNGLARQFCRENPLDALSILEADGQTSVVKIAPGHLPREALTKIIETKIAGAIFVTRNPIDSYISKRKAQTVRAWGRVDTTDVGVELVARDFVRYCQRLLGHYALCKHIVVTNRLPSVTVGYETDLNIPDSAAYINIGKRLRALGVEPGGLILNSDEPPLFKQDRNTNYEDKVVNWEEFTSELATMGLLGLMRSFSMFGSTQTKTER